LPNIGIVGEIATVREEGPPKENSFVTTWIPEKVRMSFDEEGGLLGRKR
jgi:hypothetical protein